MLLSVTSAFAVSNHLGTPRCQKRSDAALAQFLEVLRIVHLTGLVIYDFHISVQESLILSRHFCRGGFVFLGNKHAFQQSSYLIGILYGISVIVFFADQCSVSTFNKLVISLFKFSCA